jgi:hypothetical protein
MVAHANTLPCRPRSSRSERWRLWRSSICPTHSPPPRTSLPPHRSPDPLLPLPYRPPLLVSLPALSGERMGCLAKSKAPNCLLSLPYCHTVVSATVECRNASGAKTEPSVTEWNRNIQCRRLCSVGLFALPSHRRMLPRLSGLAAAFNQERTARRAVRAAAHRPSVAVPHRCIAQSQL